MRKMKRFTVLNNGLCSMGGTSKVVLGIILGAMIPPCIIGSGVAGALSMLFNCTLMAPHGGIFVFPVVGNAGMYVVALLVGTAVATALLGVLKKNVQE